jgi:hypothetical protein
MFLVGLKLLKMVKGLKGWRLCIVVVTAAVSALTNMAVDFTVSWQVLHQIFTPFCYTGGADRSEPIEYSRREVKSVSKGLKILAGALAVVVLVGALVVGTALAQEPTPTPKAPYGWHGWGRGFGFWGGGSWATFDATAQALGLTPEQLFAELHAGKSLADIAQAQGVDLQKVQDAINAARIQAMKDAINQAVKDGKISQAQADWLLQGLEQGFLPRGRGFGFFGHGFGGKGDCPGTGTAPSVAPSTSSL